MKILEFLKVFFSFKKSDVENQTDVELIELIRKSDNSATKEDIFLVLLHRHADYINNLIRHFVRKRQEMGFYVSEQDIEDIFQEVCIALVDKDYKNLTSYKGVGTFKNWLYKLIKITVISYFGRLKFASVSVNLSEKPANIVSGQWRKSTIKIFPETIKVYASDGKTLLTLGKDYEIVGDKYIVIGKTPTLLSGSKVLVKYRFMTSETVSLDGLLTSEGNESHKTLMDVIPDSSSSPDEVVEEEEKTRIIEKAISLLPEKYRRVMFLYYKGYKVKEIMEVEKISRTKMNNYMKRGKEKLVKILKKLNIDDYL